MMAIELKFAMMSNDSDFTPLILRILKNGVPVYGFAEKKSPQPFVNACSTFIYIKNLTDENQEIENKSQQKNIKANG